MRSRFEQTGRYLKLNARTPREVAIDVFSLLFQGVGVSYLQFLAVSLLLPILFPEAKGSWRIPQLAQFLVGFVVIDYLYYWNHRLLHSKWLWGIHRLHHSATDLDWLATSRNHVLAPFFILYIWVHAVFIYHLDNPRGYVVSVILTYSLDLWRHCHRSTYCENEGGRDRHLLVSPELHAYHHSRAGQYHAFGANFTVWDRLHRTLPRQRGSTRL